MLAGFAGYDAPCAVFPSIVDVCGDSTGAVLGQGDTPVVAPSGAFDQTAQKTVEIPQLQFLDKVVQISCRCAEADSHGPTVCRTKEFPQLLDTMIVIPWSRRAENFGDSHRCSSWSRCTCPFLVRLVPFARQRR